MRFEGDWTPLAHQLRIWRKMPRAPLQAKISQRPKRSLGQVSPCCFQLDLDTKTKPRQETPPHTVVAPQGRVNNNILRKLGWKYTDFKLLYFQLLGWHVLWKFVDGATGNLGQPSWDGINISLLESISYHPILFMVCSCLGARHKKKGMDKTIHSAVSNGMSP